MCQDKRSLLALFLAVLFVLTNYSAVFAQDTPLPDSSSQNYTVSNGTQVIDSAALANMTSLNVSSGATLAIDIGSQSNLNFTGDITNAGNIYAFSSNAGVTGANFSAQNIFNNGILSTVLPSSLMAGLSSAVSALNLNLQAAQQIVNTGTISSAGSLSMLAGNSITNSGVLNAVNNLNLSVGAGGLINSGSIVSQMANINIASMVSQNLLVNNTNGSMSALLGNINMATNRASSTEKLLVEMIGGDYLSKELNVTNIDGAVETNINDVTGKLNISAGLAHVQTNANNLVLGKLDLTGDPTFYNTAGGISITSDIDLRPVNFTAPGAVALAIVASGDITNGGVTNITVDAGANNINGLNWPGSVNGGSILIMAGANFTSSGSNSSATASAPAPPAPYPPGPGNTTDTLTITTSPTGGSINLSGVNISTGAGMASTAGASGDVILIAYTNGTTGGNISVGNITTGENSSPLPANDVAGINGNVYIIGAGNITTGIINTSGNVQSSSLYSGNVTIASSLVVPIQSLQNSNSWVPLFTTVNTTFVQAGSNSFNVTNTSGMSANQFIYLDPMGSATEKVQIQSINGNTITLTAPVAKDHVINERIYMDATSGQVIINPGAGTVNSVPLTQNGGNFAPDMNNIQSGTITLGQIISGGNVTVATNGSVTVGGNISLTQNPTTAPGGGTAYLRFPSINIFGNTGISVSSGVTVSSEIASCPFCYNNVNLRTASLNVASTATVIGYVVDISSATGQSLNIANNGTITGGALNGGAAINAFVNIHSAQALSLSGTGSITTPGVVSVILLSAADTQTFNLGSHTFSTGTQGLVIFNAQRKDGQITMGNATHLTFSGSPIAIFNTPNLSIGNLSILGGASTMAFSSGLAINPADGVTPLPLTVTINGSVQMNATAVNMKPLNNANLVLNPGGATANLNFSGSALLAASGTGKVQVNNALTLTGTVQQVINPSGGISGIAFQPFVGPFVNPTNGWTGYSTYSYQQVLALMGPLAATQQFQVLSTYTQIGQPNTPYYASQYVIPAAKDIGMQVSAGVFVTFNPTTGAITSPVDGSGNPVDLQPVLTAAAKYGNVIDVVVGNEDIVGGAHPAPSITALSTLISTAKGLRNGTTNPITGSAFTSSTLPITTRQVGGVYDIVNPGFGDAAATAAMVALLGNVEGYAYGNFYPFFNTDVIAALTCPTCTGYKYTYIGMSATQAQFTSLVQQNMTDQYNPVATDVKTYVGASAPVIRIGETGWGTQGITQASTTYAGYYYSAMQGWSATATDPVTGGTGVPIGTYFEAYNEPNKPTDKGSPLGTGSSVTVTQANNIGDTQLMVSNSAAFAGVSQITIYTGGQRVTATTPPPYILPTADQEFANIQPATGSTPANTLVFFSPLTKVHNIGDIVNVGEGAEPYFGLFVANGVSPGANGYAAPSTYQLTSITVSALPVYVSAPPPPAPAPVVAATDNTAFTTALLNASFTSAITSTNLALNSDPSRTIIQTDINPERTQGTPLVQSGIFAQENQNVSPNPSLFGNLVFNEGDMTQSFMSLPSGNGLFSPNQDAIVQTGFGNVQIGANAVVLIMQNKHGLSVLNLHDAHSGDVKVDLNGQTITIAPGRQVFVTNELDSDFENICPAGFGFRNLSDSKVGDSKVYQMEFSPTTALSRISLLKQLVHSANKQHQDKVAKILKTAAAMSVINKDKGPFQGH